MNKKINNLWDYFRVIPYVVDFQPIDILQRSTDMSEVKLNREIYNVEIVDNEWVCDVHTDTILEFYCLTHHHEYYACPKCGNYIKVD